MSTFEDLKKKWDENQDSASASAAYDQPALEKIFRSRIKKHTGKVMQYFRASFLLQVLVYALLGTVMVKYGSDTETLLYSIAGILLFLPFTFMLVTKCKAMAMIRPGGESTDAKAGASLYHSVLRQHDLLQSFYAFKKRYELILVPLSSAIGIFLTFKLFIPGGAAQYQEAATGIFTITLISCFAAIYTENKKSFEQPLHQLREVLGEFKRDA